MPAPRKRERIENYPLEVGGRPLLHLGKVGCRALALLVGAGLGFIVAHFLLRTNAIAAAVGLVIGGSFGLALTMGPNETIDSDDVRRVGCAGIFGLLDGFRGCLTVILGALVALILIVH